MAIAFTTTDVVSVSNDRSFSRGGRPPKLDDVIARRFSPFDVTRAGRAPSELRTALGECSSSSPDCKLIALHHSLRCDDDNGEVQRYHDKNWWWRWRLRPQIATSLIFLTNLLVVLLWCDTPGEHSSSFPKGFQDDVIISQLLRGTSYLPSITLCSSATNRYSPFPHVLCNCTVACDYWNSPWSHVHWFSSTPERQTLIVDNGSRFLMVSSAKGCGRHGSKFYNSSNTTTRVMPKCGNCYLDHNGCIKVFQLWWSMYSLSEIYRKSIWTGFKTENIVRFGTANIHESTQARLDAFDSSLYPLLSNIR